MTKTTIVDIAEYDALTNYTLVDGVTPDIIKRKYIWLLNALVLDAIIGQDDYGLVWYSGTWLSGEWEDGTWYSGVWEDGEWKNGKFYSIHFDTRQLLLRNKRVIEKDNPKYSEFRHGIWRRGEFYNGYFGPEYDFEHWGDTSLYETIFYPIRWEGGTFSGGVFRNATWHNGMFQNGIFYNSQWLKGTFFNGTFQGYKWWSGNFTGGDFVEGYWSGGTFNQSDPNVKSRFGSFPYSASTEQAGTSVIWFGGDFINGEFHSGLNIISGITQVSNNHNRTWWMSGNWYNGSWYGGTHISGNFNNGYWYDGYWSGGTFNNGFWYNGFWYKGVINNGYFIQGIFINMSFYGGLMGYQPLQYLIDKELSASSTLTKEPKIYVPSYYINGIVSNLKTKNSTNIFTPVAIPTTTTTTIALTTSTTTIALTTSTTTILSPTTTTTTTIILPLNFDISYNCSPFSVGIDAHNVIGGTGGYRFGTSVFTSEALALSNTSWVIATSISYGVGVDGTYWVALRDSADTRIAKSVTTYCTTTTTTTVTPTTTTTTIPPITTTTTTELIIPYYVGMSSATTIGESVVLNTFSGFTSYVGLVSGKTYTFPSIQRYKYWVIPDVSSGLTYGNKIIDRITENNINISMRFDAFYDTLQENPLSSVIGGGIYISYHIIVINSINYRMYRTASNTSAYTQFKIYSFN